MKNLKYILMVLLGGTMYGTMSSLVKLAYRRGFNAAELSFWQRCYWDFVPFYRVKQKRAISKARMFYH